MPLLLLPYIRFLTLGSYAAFKKKTKKTGPQYTQVIPNPSDARRRIIDDKRNKTNGNTAHGVQCGHFDENYIKSLKGMYHKCLKERYPLRLSDMEQR
jgi:hypothetical protein